MRIAHCVALLTLTGALAPAQAFPTEASLPALPTVVLEKQYEQIQKNIEHRTALFLKGHPFQRWIKHKPRSEILKEFEQLNTWRLHAWYVDPEAPALISRNEFMIAQAILEKGYFVKPAYIAFQYNQTDGSYNASTVLLNGFRFLALESPTPKTLKNFWSLLPNHHVTQLVRLAGRHEKNAGATTEGNLAISFDPKTQAQYLKIPYPIRYEATSTWEKNAGIDAKSLLTLIQKVRKTHLPNSVVAVHSADGAGRTGTFIAGFLLLNEIDRQIKQGVSLDNLEISIEKTVMQLSLQRSYLVQTPAQYETLYQLVGFYLDNLQ